MNALYNLVAQGVVDPGTLPNNGTGDPGSAAINTILSIVFGFAAAIALLMIVIAGFRYIIASGDPEATAHARNTIIYAVIGLLISLIAFSIVTFVLKGIA